jgi:hypothetical protein
MRAARRVPWASKVELNEMYDMVFAPDADEVLKKRGLARVRGRRRCKASGRKLTHR